MKSEASIIGARTIPKRVPERKRAPTFQRFSFSSPATRPPAPPAARSAHSYLALVRNEHIIRAANDREIGELMAKFEFEKALDYALGKPKAQ